MSTMTKEARGSIVDRCLAILVGFVKKYRELVSESSSAAPPEMPISYDQLIVLIREVLGEDYVELLNTGPQFHFTTTSTVRDCWERAVGKPVVDLIDGLLAGSDPDPAALIRPGVPIEQLLSSFVLDLAFSSGQAEQPPANHGRGNTTNSISPKRDRRWWATDADFLRLESTFASSLTTTPPEQNVSPALALTRALELATTETRATDKPGHLDQGTKEESAEK